MTKHKSYVGYQIVSHIIKIAGHIWFGAKVVGKKNIPKKGKCILAGNHLSNFDAYMLYSGTNRPIHIIAKKELFTSKFGWFFRMMHLIPVDRSNKNPDAKKEVLDLLERDKVIGIFPEGTYHKKGKLLPFKPGVISFAEKSGAPIIPFAMKGTWKFRSRPVISFGKPIYINKVKSEDKVKYLEEIVLKMIEDLEKNKTK